MLAYVLLQRKRIFDEVTAAVRKFTPEEATQIKARLDAGETVTKLAVVFKAHRTTVSKIKGNTYFLPYRRNRNFKRMVQLDLFYAT